jgi:putative Mn2+ efflux pump MntP
MIEAFLLAVALAMDATAVAAARAVAGLRRREVLLLAASFGLFQAGMAAIGWLVGAGARSVIDRWDHWLAFGLLAGIGGNMLIAALRAPPADAAAPAPLDVRTLLVLSVATSIDALAAGVTLPTIGAPVALSLPAIGLVTFALSLGGAAGGAAIGARGGRGLELLGGVTLIAIGIRTLWQHLAASGA